MGGEKDIARETGKDMREIETGGYGIKVKQEERPIKGGIGDSKKRRKSRQNKSTENRNRRGKRR